MDTLSPERSRAWPREPGHATAAYIPGSMRNDYDEARRSVTNQRTTDAKANGVRIRSRAPTL